MKNGDPKPLQKVTLLKKCLFVCARETLDLLDTELKIENVLRNVTCALKEGDDVMPTLLFCTASLPE